MGRADTRCATGAWSQIAGDAPPTATCRWSPRSLLEDGALVPTSSASAPGTVIRMLEHVKLADGMCILEIDTGTGFPAALLAARPGEENVASVEVDATLVEQARANLRRAGRESVVRQADGALGWAQGAPFDRVIATWRCGPPRRHGWSRPGLRRAGCGRTRTVRVPATR